MLYDKIYRTDMLRHAYAVARANAGAAGVDEETFAQIEASGLERWLAGLREEALELIGGFPKEKGNAKNNACVAQR